MSYRLVFGFRSRRYLHAPITAAEFAQVMQPFGIAPDHRLGIAVSGGVDSMALLRLAVEWHRGRLLSPLFVFSVNHDLRPEAAEEVLWVSEQCRSIGMDSQLAIRHVPLKIFWPDKSLPYSKLQAEARHARYELLGRACNQHQIDRLLVAHHLNDQTETFLLRLARASGIEGLGCMHSQAQSSFGTAILRPLLAFSKPRLIASCQERFGQSWRDDPSNENFAFDRVRVRSVVNRLPPEFLQRLYITVRHFQDLHTSVEKLCKNAILEVCTWVHPLSACWISIPRLRRENRSVARAVLTEVFKTMSSEPKLKLKFLNDFLNYIYEDTQVVLGFRNMFGCRIRRFPDSILVVPDYDRPVHSNSKSLSHNEALKQIQWGTATFTRLSGSLPTATSILPVNYVWKQLRNQLKRRNYIERLPNSPPAYIKEANSFAIVCSKTNRIVAVPALQGILLDATFSSILTV